MTFNSPHSPISMLQSVFTKPLDALPANFSTLIGGGGIVILVMIWDKIMQFFYCSKVFWPGLKLDQDIIIRSKIAYLKMRENPCHLPAYNFAHDRHIVKINTSC